VAEIARLFPDHELDERQAEALREGTRIAEALIFVSSEPVDEKDIGKHMPDGVTAERSTLVVFYFHVVLVLRQAHHCHQHKRIEVLERVGFLLPVILACAMHIVWRMP
jgi:hypothetical protein